ncbi:MAG TPA: glycosyltransferase family 2 protein, partial [Burkholderiaceae bacterium]
MAALISVALCTYNGAAHLSEQLESLLTQTWRHIEIVAVDDASTDATWDILRQAAKRDPRLRIMRNEENLGFAANFERAMSLCTGDYIAPCDQDDLWLPDKLERLLDAIGQHSLAYCDSMLIDDRGQPLDARVSNRIHMVQGRDPLAFAFWNCISGHAMLFRRELLASALPRRDVRFHDWWIAFVAASLGSITYVDEPLVAYRQHTSSQTDMLRLRQERGDSAAKSLERIAWLGALSRFPSPHQALFETMHRLAVARQDQWLCPAWWRFLRENSARLMAINQRESFSRFALKQFFGMRWRRRAMSKGS